MTTTDFGTKLPGLKCPRWPLCGDPHNDCVTLGKFPKMSKFQSNEDDSDNSAVLQCNSYATLS